MNYFRILLFLFFLFTMHFISHAQLAKTVDEMEDVYKECLRTKPDSNACFKNFWFQIDSIEKILVNTITGQLKSDEKAAFIKEEISWSSDKKQFFKKQDETFKFNLQDGIWKKDMIRISYQQKAEFILKRVRVLLKRIIL